MRRFDFRLPAFFLILMLLLPAVVLADGKIVRRAAFDIGSSTIKCKVADVDVKTGRIVKSIYYRHVGVEFAEDLARNGEWFSPTVIRSGINALKELKAIAKANGATAYSAIGTGIFVEAANGAAFFKRVRDDLDIPARVLPQAAVAKLIYHAARDKTGIDPRRLVVWDIGGSHMEITASVKPGTYLQYAGEMASVTFKNSFIVNEQFADPAVALSPNPVTREQAMAGVKRIAAFARKDVPGELAALMGSRTVKVVGVGGVFNYSLPPQIGGDVKVIRLDEVTRTLYNRLGWTDRRIGGRYAATQITNLVLVQGFMEGLGVRTVTPMMITIADGLLVAPEYWD